MEDKKRGIVKRVNIFGKAESIPHSSLTTDNVKPAITASDINKFITGIEGELLSALCDLVRH